MSMLDLRGGSLRIDHIDFGRGLFLTRDADRTGFLLRGGALTLTNDFIQGSDATDRVIVKGIYMNPASFSVTIPSVTDPDSGSVAEDVSGSFSFQPAVGDAVIAIPEAAMPTNCLYTGCSVTGTDEITLTYTSIGGNITGAGVNYRFLLFDLT